MPQLVEEQGTYAVGGWMKAAVTCKYCKSTKRRISLKCLVDKQMGRRLGFKLVDCVWDFSNQTSLWSRKDS